MRLLHVFPIERGIGKDTLSYFSGADVPSGNIVSVPLRNKNIPALVIDSEAVAEAKTEIRKSDFALRKITPKAPRALFYPSYIEAITRAGEYYAASPGSLFAATLPKSLFKDYSRLAVPHEIKKNRTGEVTSEKLVFQGDQGERFEHHKNLVREEFARKRSVFILVPTITDAEKLDAFLSRGIPDYVFTLHSGIVENELRRRWNGAISDPHPIVIIGTGSFLSIPRFDLGTIIVERENTHSYKSMVRPFADMRIIAEYLAEALHARFILADLPLRIESVFRLREGEFEERAPIRSRVVETTQAMLVDMRVEKPKAKHEKFVVLGAELLDRMRQSLSEGENVFLFTVRRGLSPITVCEDCGNAVLCDVTKTPVILHKGPKGNVFVCHSCGAIRSAEERCRFCGSWKLQSLGIGNEYVQELLEEQFPDTPILMIDKDKTPTHRDAVRVAAKFEHSHGVILLGTELAISYLPERVPIVGIVSIDTLLSLPEWNAYERVFGIITRLRSVASKMLIVQSRKTEADVLEQALRGNTNEFFKSEIEGRRQFGYPPFTTFIKVTCEGNVSQVEEDAAELERMFAPYGWSGRSHLMHTGKSSYLIHGFIRVPHKSWPKAELVRLLKTLPLHITVNVDPESIL